MGWRSRTAPTRDPRRAPIRRARSAPVRAETAAIAPSGAWAHRHARRWNSRPRTPRTRSEPRGWRRTTRRNGHRKEECRSWNRARRSGSGRQSRASAHPAWHERKRSDGASRSSEGCWALAHPRRPGRVAKKGRSSPRVCRCPTGHKEAFGPTTVVPLVARWTFDVPESSGVNLDTAGVSREARPLASPRSCGIAARLCLLLEMTSASARSEAVSGSRGMRGRAA